MNKNNKIIAVCGPTASGKTSLAVELAIRLNGEVVSCDSMQIYKGMEIGTAAPTMEERRGVPHHLVGICSPDRDFSCAEYSELGKTTADDILARGKLPVFCGGTGLYLDSVTAISSYSDSYKDTALREELERFAEEMGVDALHERLRKIDPPAAEATHKNNVRRVIRAIEIFETSGKTKTEWDLLSKEQKTPYDMKMIVLHFSDRELLYKRIEKRVDLMVRDGLLEEAEHLYSQGLLNEDFPAFQAIGYKELIPYLKGEESLETGLERIKQNTRRYAKRQITWFKRYKDAIVISPDCDGVIRPFEDIVAEATERLN